MLVFLGILLLIFGTGVDHFCLSMRLSFRNGNGLCKTFVLLTGSHLITIGNIMPVWCQQTPTHVLRQTILSFINEQTLAGL